MISTKPFVETPEHDVVEALRQVGHLLLDAIATHTVRGTESDLHLLRHALRPLARQLDKPTSALDLLSTSSGAVGAMETYCHHTEAYFRQEKEQLQSMVLMLTDTLADLAGQSDASFARLQSIEKNLEMALALKDVRAVRSGLENWLQSLRETTSQQRSSASATIQRLRDHIETGRVSPFSEPDRAPVPEPSAGQMELVRGSFVAGFKLKRAEHIVSRFGEAAAHQMRSTLGAILKEMVDPKDRLLPWKGTSFVMFINSMPSLDVVRALLADTVTRIGTQRVEVGANLMLSIGVDWIVLQQAGHTPLEAVLAEVDSFLAGPSSQIAAAGSRSK